MADGNDKIGTIADRRKDVRYLLVLKVSEERENIFFGYAKDLSKSGMFISTVNPRNIGEEFSISFKIPKDGPRVICRCRVVWKREYDPKTLIEPGMGMEFVDLPPEIGKKIDEWVEKP